MGEQRGGSLDPGGARALSVRHWAVRYGIPARGDTIGSRGTQWKVSRGACDLRRLRPPCGSQRSSRGSEPHLSGALLQCGPQKVMVRRVVQLPQKPPTSFPNLTLRSPIRQHGMRAGDFRGEALRRDPACHVRAVWAQIHGRACC